MASGTRGSSVPRFSTTGRATSLQHVLKNVLECDLTLPLYLTFFLTSLVRHMQMGSRTSSLPVSRNRQRANTASGLNRRLRMFLQRIYVRCYPNVKDGTRHQS
jgi:hypothetical protein